MNTLLIALVLFAMLLPGCVVKKAPDMAVPEGTQAGDLTGLDEHAQAKAALQNLLGQQVEKQDILGMVMDDVCLRPFRRQARVEEDAGRYDSACGNGGATSMGSRRRST